MMTRQLLAILMCLCEYLLMTLFVYALTTKLHCDDIRHARAEQFLAIAGTLFGQIK